MVCISMLVSTMLATSGKLSTCHRKATEPTATCLLYTSKAVQGLVSLAAQFGEGWLLPADLVGYIRDDVNNIISLQPFGCIANHVISKRCV